MMGGRPARQKQYDEPLSTAAAAELVEVSARTLIRYEELGLVFPRYEGKARLFSAQDIKWLRCLRELIHGKKISIASLKRLLKNSPCWKVNDCRHDEFADCMKSPDKRRTGATDTQKRAPGKRRVNRP